MLLGCFWGALGCFWGAFVEYVCVLVLVEWWREGWPNPKAMCLREEEWKSGGHAPVSRVCTKFHSFPKILNNRMNHSHVASPMEQNKEQFFDH